MKRTSAPALALLLLLATPVAAGQPRSTGELEALVAAGTGISRVVDANLQTRAMHRTTEVQVEWEHCCLLPGEGEVVAKNIGFANPEPQMLIGWQRSPDHWAILIDPAYTRIGCATQLGDDGWTYGVCIVGGPSPFIPGSQPTPGPAVLPDTALPPSQSVGATR